MMSSKLPCKQLLCSGRTAWCIGLLLMFSSMFAAAAEDYRQYSVPGSYGQERASAAVGSYGQERVVGGYGQESAYTYGYVFSSDSAGAYADGTLETAELILDQMMAGPVRKLLQAEITVPADSSSDSSSSMELDIIPAEVPAANAWDAQTWNSWEQWYAKTNDADAATLATAAYGLENGAYGMSESAPKYGAYQEAGRPGGYGGYGAEGAYFDFRSGTVYQPESVPQQQQEAGTPPIIELSAAGADGVHLATMQQQPVQMDPATALLGGVTRSRGLPPSTALPEKSMRSTFTGQLNLPSLNIASQLQPVIAAGSIGRKLLSVLLYDGLLDSTTPKQMRHQEMLDTLRPKRFSRKLRMASRA